MWYNFDYQKNTGGFSMIVNVYNKSGVVISVGNLVIEVGHNFIPFEQWGKVSNDTSIVSLIQNCSLLVGNYQEYVAYKGALDYFSDSLTQNIQYCKDDAVLERLNEISTEIEANKIVLELFAEQFINDTETKNAYANLDIQKYIDEVDRARSEIESADAKISTSKSRNRRFL